MAYHSLKKTVSERLAEIRAAGLYKSERQILGPQGAEIRVAQGEVLNLCANNYLGNRKPTWTPNSPQSDHLIRS